MIVVEIEKGERPDKLLRRFKRRAEKAGITREVRRRMEFKKPSVARRQQRIKAIYRQKKELGLI